MALTITVNINDADQVALENDLLDIEDWVQNAVVGKINSCKKRMARQATQILKDDPTVDTMPANDGELITALKGRSNYRNRKEKAAALESEL